MKKDTIKKIIYTLIIVILISYSIIIIEYGIRTLNLLTIWGGIIYTGIASLIYRKTILNENIFGKKKVTLK